LGGCLYCNDSDSTGRDWTFRQLDSSGSALQMGLTLEQIAQGLNWPIEEVKQAAPSDESVLKKKRSAISLVDDLLS
jgi:hypothetical protein